MLKLTQAVEDFYSAFSDVEVPLHIDGCPCCIYREEIDKLLSTSLRELAPGDLSVYAMCALSTVGAVSDYLYFLPRIMDISVHEDSWSRDIEVKARAIHSTDIHSWPPDRREALVALLDAVVQNIVESKAYSKIDGWLCAIGGMEIDVRPALAMIETDSEAILHYFGENAEALKRGKLSNGFWELPNVGHDTIVQWFNSDAVCVITLY